MKKKLLLLVVAIVGVYLFNHFGLGEYLTLDYLKSKQSEFQEFYSARPWQVILMFSGIYVLSTTLFLPGATVLTLAAGAIFGVVKGTIIVSFVSSIGATGSFLITRYLFRDFAEKKFGTHLAKVNKGVEKDGWAYLLMMRLIPAVPFFAINSLMGLTRMNLLTFYIVSQLGMLAGTAVYVNLGTQLANINSLGGLVSKEVLLGFALLGIVPFIIKKTVEFFKAQKVYSRFKRPSKYDYNMAVIGGGSAGLVSAYIAAAVKAKVVLIEKHKMGGDCLNTGCVPSKALIRSAKMVKYIQRFKDWGFDNASVDINFAKVMERVQQVIKKVEPHDSHERYNSLGVETITGEAKIVSPWEIQVNDKTITAKNIIVATGARPLVPPIQGLDQIEYFTSDNIWEIRERPQRLLVLGGGPIGSELCQCFQRLGSQVTQVEMAPRILIREDDDVAQAVIDSFKADGIQVLTDHKAIRFEKNGDDKTLVCEYRGEEVKVPFDQVLLAIGRKANVTGFGLEELGVEISPRGTVVADDFLRTNYPNIFVCGDVTGPFQFTHTAAHQAWYCAVNSLFGKFKKFKVDYSCIPWCTYTDPEVAQVGHNEKSAKEAGIEFEVTTYGIDDLDRAIADSEDHGLVKVLTAPGTDKILGVTIVGTHAGDLIAEFILAKKWGLGLNKILGTIHIYPTLAEANKYAAGNWKKANAPQNLLKWVEKFHSFMRG